MVTGLRRRTLTLKIIFIYNQVEFPGMGKRVGKT
ncbi:hypothetical protein PMI05_04036 [Brevibacillus sp. BC25]|nr:hypothetical protein PMI05_04036 [Brevibacillus sp. BC25]